MKMQGKKFSGIDEFLGYIDQNEFEIVDLLRNIILETIPNCQEKLSYNVPFYSRFKTICYIWPGSVLWGKKQTYTGVRLGFYIGYLMSDQENILHKDNRKQVYWVHFNSVSEMNKDVIHRYIQEALIIDEQLQFCG
jgi:hypothetical protein